MDAIRSHSGTTLSDLELVCRFESLGRYCEFGFLQRCVGAEPIGLLRFAGLRLDGLVRALDARFADIGDPDNVRITQQDGEYRIEVVNFGFRYHADVFEGDIAPEQLHVLECRKLRVLAHQLISGLEQGSRIFVYQQRDPLSARDLVRLLAGLGRYGAPMLLWVQEATTENQPGTVELVGDRLMVGYLERMTPPEAVHEPHVASWLAVCREAHAIWSAGPGASLTEDAGTAVSEIVFGCEGNSAPFLREGWADPEMRYTWGIGENSVLAVPNPPGTGDLLLRLVVWPFVRAGILPAQRLVISVNQVELASFQLTIESRLQCPVPASLLDGHETIDITFHHPDAAQPGRLAGGNIDTRRLAVAFRRIALYRASATPTGQG
jgi:hypothetical protein